MPNEDLRVARPDDDSDERVLVAVSEPLWPLWIKFGDSEDP